MDPSETLLAKNIDRLSSRAVLFEKLESGIIRCHACAHRCVIKPGERGFCKVRFNRDGILYSPRGYVSGLQNDPVEKKPFYHVHPGSAVMTFGMLGCDMRCSYCQNWDISQALRDSDAGRSVIEITPEEIVTLAKRHQSKSIASSYNEPLITAEWSVSIFEIAIRAGLTTLFVSNGNATPEVLSYIKPVTHGFKVDLKTMEAEKYRELGASRDKVLDTIMLAHEMGFWVELVTLVVPGFNDSHEEIGEMIRFIRGINPGIPWHVTGFHPMYRMMDKASTPARQLVGIAERAMAEGLHFVYAGNRPGQVGHYENTRCPVCDHQLIERFAYNILNVDMTSDGKCPQCGTRIPGIW